jgi:uncharacterized protein
MPISADGYHDDRAQRSPRRTIPCAPRLTALCTLVAVSLSTAVSAQQTFPVPRDHVEDRAGVLDAATRRQIDGYLTELESKSGAQVILLTLRTTAGEDIREFGLRHAEAWKLGQKGKDNGALILIAVDDREYAFETGEGLEGTLPDSWLGRMTREFFVPNFRKGDFAAGLTQGTIAIVNKIADDAGVTIGGIPDYRVRARAEGRRARSFNWFFWIIILIVILSSIGGGRRRRRRNRGNWIGPWLIFEALSAAGRSSRRGGWGGGGFGGFGGGSFGGGGGGSFGGGGVRGSW